MKFSKAFVQSVVEDTRDSNFISCFAVGDLVKDSDRLTTALSSLGERYESHREYGADGTLETCHFFGDGHDWQITLHRIGTEA